jgi:hypothetical protein
MAYPKIVYNGRNLNFTYPPVQKAGAHDSNSDPRTAERSDTVTTSGQKQTIFKRTDHFRILQMDFVPMEDLIYWAAFIEWAIAGNNFAYYPDASLSAFDTWTLEDTDWNPKLNFGAVPHGVAKFSLKLRRVNGGSASS